MTNWSLSKVDALCKCSRRVWSCCSQLYHEERSITRSLTERNHRLWLYQEEDHSEFICEQLLSMLLVKPSIISIIRTPFGPVQISDFLLQFCNCRKWNHSKLLTTCTSWANTLPCWTLDPLYSWYKGCPRLPIQSQTYGIHHLKAGCVHYPRQPIYRWGEIIPHSTVCGSIGMSHIHITSQGKVN